MLDWTKPLHAMKNDSLIHWHSMFMGVALLAAARSKDARKRNGAVAALGRGLVVGMPPFLVLLGWVGLAAMLWVGGHIVIDGLHKFGIDAPHDLLHAQNCYTLGATPDDQTHWRP